MRVLLSAYQCGPGMGSVSTIGWEWYSRLRDRADVTLVTHVRNRPALEAAGVDCDAEHIWLIDTEWFGGPLYRFASWLFPHSEHPVFMISSLDFFLYDWIAARRAKSRQWDVIHAVTPVTTAAPSWLSRLDAPFVWGPLNCGLGTPAGFPEIFARDSSWLYALREFGAWADKLIGCANHAAAILAATEATRQAIPGKPGRIVPFVENGVDLERFAPTPSTIGKGPLRVLFVGRLIPVKGVGMLLEAMATLDRVELTVIGDGPMRQEWEAKAEPLGERVRFLGALPHEEVSRHMAECHVFCLPSIRESGGAVLLEAMACARPVIAAAFGGPAEIVTDEVGRLVAMPHREALVAGLAEVLRDVLDHPAAWAAKGQAGRAIVEARYSWDAKIDQALALYGELAR